MTIQSEHSVRRWSSRRTIGRVFALSLVMTTATATMGTAAGATPSHGGSQDLGPNVTVFDPSTPVSEIQAKLDATYTKQVDNEMGTARYAYYFKPGTYGTADQPLQFKVGYYTEIAGLGADPSA